MLSASTQQPARRIFATLLSASLLLPVAGQAQPVPPAKSPAKPGNFDQLTCQSDIAVELIGRKMSNAKVQDIEARYRSLQLSYRGGHGMPEDPFILGFWTICGRDYVVLESNKLKSVKAVLKSPVASAEGELTVGGCQTAAGKKLESVVFLRPSSKKTGPWTVDSSWTVREPQLEFAAIPEKRLTCTE